MIKRIMASLLLVAAGFMMCRAETVETYRLDMKDFTEIQVIDGLNVVCLCNPDSAGIVSFSCAKDIVPSIFFSNKNGKLKVQRNVDVVTPDTSFPTITVYSSALQSVENYGDSLVTVDSPTPGELFKVRVIGNGTITATNIHATRTEGTIDTGKGHIVLGGATRAVKLKNIGTGRIEASGLSAETGVVTILGTGPVDCSVSEELTVKGMGTGKVYVIGKPKIKKRSLGTIEIIEVE